MGVTFGAGLFALDLALSSLFLADKEKSVEGELSKV